MVGHASPPATKSRRFGQAVNVNNFERQLSFIYKPCQFHVRHNHQQSTIHSPTLLISFIKHPPVSPFYNHICSIMNAHTPYVTFSLNIINFVAEDKFNFYELNEKSISKSRERQVGAKVHVQHDGTKNAEKMWALCQKYFHQNENFYFTLAGLQNQVNSYVPSHHYVHSQILYINASWASANKF